MASAKLHASKDWSADDFSEALDGLGDELVNDEAYREAVNYGRKAVPGVHRDDNDPVAHVWTSRVNPYAQQVPGRVAQQLADAATEADTPDASVQDVLDRINAKLDALRSSITRYAQPTWGAGQQGYGAQLDAYSVLMEWVLDAGVDDHCGDCLSLADRGPYAYGDIPTWPGAGDTICRDRCYCEISAESDSWDAAFGQAA